MNEEFFEEQLLEAQIGHARLASEVMQYPHIDVMSTVQQNSIVFYVGEGKEVMRFEENGDIFVKGRLVENDVEVIQQFKEWLGQARK